MAQPKTQPDGAGLERGRDVCQSGKGVSESLEKVEVGGVMVPDSNPKNNTFDVK